jgi:catalase
MVLDRNPENYFAEVEQAAFSPGNFVPGIGPSPDKMLQGRLFSYPDTHRHRLGANYHLLPINAPKAARETNYQRDGEMRLDGNGGVGPNYWPNSFGGPAPDPGYAVPAIDVAGMAERHAYVLGDVDFVQAGTLYSKVMTDTDREHLVANIVGHLKGAQKRIQLRQTALFYKAAADYGERVAAGLGLDANEVKKLAAMSQEDRVKATAA